VPLEGTGEVTGVVGISCGLSAPFVAGQLSWAFQRQIPAAGVGFNDLSSSAVQEAFRDKRLTLVNPIVGPEAVTGSSRMKGGSATKMLLERAFMPSISWDTYKAAHASIYEGSAVASLARLAGFCGNALLTNVGDRGASIVYIGRGTVGVLGLIDASEQRPTFGAKVDDVRGCLLDWGGTKYAALSSSPSVEVVLPSLLPGSVVILKATTTNEEAERDLSMVKSFLPASGVLLWVVSIAEARPSFVEPSTVTHVEIPTSITSAPPSNQHSRAALIETAAKWVVNYLSTTAHVLKGCVYKNRMINVCITNQKLFRRAVGIVRDVAGVGEVDGWSALLAACFVSHEVRKYPRCGICK